MADETNIVMPPLGESVVEGVINKWLKKVGDLVKEDELLVEVTTDKINTEIPSIASGTLAKILAQEGDTVKVGAPMCIISKNGLVAAASPAAASAIANAVPMPPAEPVITPAALIPVPYAPAEPEDTGLYPVDPNNVITVPPPKKKSSGDTDNNGVGVSPLIKEKSSPLVRRILAENGLDTSILERVTGTGIDGRVTKDDILTFLASNKSAVPAAAPASPEVPSPKPSSEQSIVNFANPGVTVPTDTDAVITPLAGIRKIIAERLSYSEHIAPHVTTFAEVDVTDLVALRARYKDWAKEEEGVSLTFLPFVLKAVTAGLKVFPAINSSLLDGQVYTHKNIHVAIAVSLDQTGLILPVIKNADRLGIIELARGVQDLAARARTNKLTADEARGSTFTISNPGAFGGWISTPIINQPNAAILNTGTIKKMAWVMPDDSIAVRSIMFLSLSYDHRLVDGETSVKFLQFVKKNLEQIDKFLLR
jgi:2-oxoglutarate dehydrogenase E2 component (dihydrolipoamide succinyltransferase)